MPNEEKWAVRYESSYFLPRKWILDLSFQWTFQKSVEVHSHVVLTHHVMRPRPAPWNPLLVLLETEPFYRHGQWWLDYHFPRFPSLLRGSDLTIVGCWCPSTVDQAERPVDPGAFLASVSIYHEREVTVYLRMLWRGFRIVLDNSHREIGALWLLKKDGNQLGYK